MRNNSLCTNIITGTVLRNLKKNKIPMKHKFKTGDHVTWNSEAGRVSGTIIKINTADFNYKGYEHHASEDDPQYAIKSSKTDHIAVHKEAALSKVSD
jgi:hypothetical protein